MPPIDDCKSILARRWNSTSSGPLFELEDPSPVFLKGLPTDYLSIIGEFGGREGFLGEEYLRLYRIEELVTLNFAYEVQTFLPEIVVFGSNGCGEAFAFLLHEPTVVQVPFLPLAIEHATHRANSFAEFVRTLASFEHSPPCNPEGVGKEVHDKHPICLGGSPTDPENKVLVPAAKHAEICTHWNKVYRLMSDQQAK
jgi:hypothetical protein